MSMRPPIVHYSLLAAAVAALCALVYVQIADHLPESLQISNVTSLRQKYPACALAAVSHDHVFVSASVRQGGMQSGLVFGTMPWATKTVQVSVEPGDKPMTVFLSGFGVIWHFSGSVDRVRRVVAMSDVMNQMVGVAGIPADRVEIPPHAACAYFNDAMSLQDAAVRAKALAVMFGRRSDYDAYQYQAFNLSLPEASFALRTEPASGTPQRPLTPGDVVAVVPVSKPAVMPGKAGLEQLEADGAIRKPTADEVHEFLAGASRPYRSKLSPDFLLQQTFDYAITREIVLPQGFPFGPKFLVLAGVKPPREPYHGCLAQMDGFRITIFRNVFQDPTRGLSG